MIIIFILILIIILFLILYNYYKSSSVTTTQSPSVTTTQSPSVTTTQSQPFDSAYTIDPNVYKQQKVGEPTLVAYGIAFFGSVAVEIVIEKLIKKIIGEKIEDALTIKIRSRTIRTIKSLSGKGARYIASAFGFGEKVTKNLTQKAIIEISDDAAITAGKAAGKAAGITAGKTVGSIGSKLLVDLSLGPVGIAMLGFEVASLILDLTDAGGYGMLGTWKIISNKIKKEVEKLTSSSDGTSIEYPTEVGPLDALYLKTVCEGSDQNSLVSCPPPSSSLPPPENLYNYLLKKQLNIVITNATKNDPVYNSMIINMKNEIKNKPPTKTYDDVVNYVKTYIDLNIETYITQALSTLCNQYNGVMNSNNQCVYSEQNCKNDNLGDTDIAGAWSNSQKKCLSVNPVIKGICNKNGLPYNINTGICQITDKLCLQKTGVPQHDSAGNLEECVIPKGKMVAELIFGKTIVDSLDQIFNPNQYESCKENQIDDGLICRNKCKDDYSYIGVFCVNKPPIKPMGPSTPPSQDNSACNDLSNVVAGIGTCTGTKKKCGRKGKKGWGGGVIVNFVDNIINGCYATRKASRSCKKGYSLIGALCYKDCGDGYHRNPGDIVSCYRDGYQPFDFKFNDPELNLKNLSGTYIPQSNVKKRKIPFSTSKIDTDPEDIS